LALGTCLAAPASADLTVKGDQAAWREISAAYAKLNALPGYRIKTEVPGGGTLVMEMVPATRGMHSVAHTPNGDLEMIAVGDQTRLRGTAPGAPAGWQCTGVPSVPKFDPAAIQGTVDVARAPDAAIDGQPMHVYVYTAQASGGGMGMSGEIKTTLYVGVENGLPRRAVVGASRGDQAVDFYDYGAAIQITLPPCSSS
jgi:hypothetical protein